MKHDSNLPEMVRDQAFTQEVAKSIVKRNYADIPQDVKMIARQCILDTLGVSYAGASEEVIDILVAQSAEEGCNTGCTLAGRSESVPLSYAALINGAAAHALDYDDVNMAAIGHPSAAIMPSVLALAEFKGATGKQLIEAFVSGYEAMCQIGALISVDHYGAGFHTTATLGSYGAAAACAKLLGLDETKTRTALGIAGTQAAGLKMMFGTMCKPLHAGTASQHGLFAATWANRGFTSRLDVLEGKGGLFQTQCGAIQVPYELFSPGNYLMRNNLFKYHASCYNTHAAIEAVLKLTNGKLINPADVDQVVIHAGRQLDTVCNIFEPTTGLEAKFSFRQTCAFAMAGLDTSDIATFSDENANAPHIRALRDKIKVEMVDADSNYIECDWIAKGGEKRSSAHDSGIPNANLPDQERRLRNKFDRLVTPLAGSDNSKTIFDMVSRIDQLDSLVPLMKALKKT